jgi:DNA-binding NtrC family response regulator
MYTLASHPTPPSRLSGEGKRWPVALVPMNSRRLVPRSEPVPHPPSAHTADEPALIGVSPAFHRLIRMIDRVARTDHALLLFAATGEGKELVARRARGSGLRSDQPPVDANCGAVPENLLEAELFGHVEGAFTGAGENRLGLFQQVGKGTLLRYEVGKYPLALQPKLLRVLETPTFRPLGSSTSQRFEGRVVAATHWVIRAMAQDGQFREDLFCRIAVLVLTVSGLDQRNEDIPSLVNCCAEQQSRPIEFSPTVMKRLRQHALPGHICQFVT